MCCVLSSKRLIGPIFIDGMVTGMKYRELLEHHFSIEAGRLIMTRLNWFMQDGGGGGARPHRIADIFMWFGMAFNERLIALDQKNSRGMDQSGLRTVLS